MNENIGKKIRDTLLKIDARLVYARGELEIAKKDYNLYSKRLGKRNKRKALEAKIDRECFKSYIGELVKAKEDILKDLEKVLSRYTPRFKAIWSMYFIQEYTTREIAEKVKIDEENIKKIIIKLKKDLGEYYGGEN